MLGADKSESSTPIFHSRRAVEGQAIDGAGSKHNACRISVEDERLHNSPHLVLGACPK